MDVPLTQKETPRLRDFDPFNNKKGLCKKPASDMGQYGISYTCFISFFLWRLYKWSQIYFNFQREGGREVKIFNNRNYMYRSS